MADVVKTYTRDGITVLWKPGLCQHSGICARGLPLVFDPRRRPWIQLEQAEMPAITAQVERCPSGALSWTKIPPDEPPPSPEELEAQREDDGE